MEQSGNTTAPLMTGLNVEVVLRESIMKETADPKAGGARVASKRLLPF
jgi:hypothetical protein